jgi:hypothetical protein
MFKARMSDLRTTPSIIVEPQTGFRDHGRSRGLVFHVRNFVLIRGDLR